MKSMDARSSNEMPRFDYKTGNQDSPRSVQLSNMTMVAHPIITWHCLQSSHCWGKTLDQGPFSVLSKLRLCSANYRAGYFSNLSCDWQSIVWAYSEQETENGPRFWTPQRHLTSGPDGHSLSGSFWSVHCQCLRDNWPFNINGTRTALYRFFLENQCIWKCCAMKLYLLKP